MPLKFIHWQYSLTAADGLCPLSRHKCPTSKECIDKAYMCDGILDCADKSDEAEETCNPPPAHCDNGYVGSYRWYCQL